MFAGATGFPSYAWPIFFYHTSLNLRGESEIANLRQTKYIFVSYLPKQCDSLYTIFLHTMKKTKKNEVHFFRAF